MDAGLDSLPGAGAEILDNGVRRAISPGKPDADRWLSVMRTAHRLGLPTSATMMYGHVETPRQRVELGRDIGAARLAERLLALGACDFHDCHAYTVPLLFARGDAGKLRLFLRGALIQRLGLHRQIRSWLHRLTSRLVFPESRGICEKFF